MPHDGQIIAIYRIFGIGYKDSKKDDITGLDKVREFQIKDKFNPHCLFNNLVEMENGDGKGLVIAISAVILALWGFDVTCV